MRFYEQLRPEGYSKSPMLHQTQREAGETALAVTFLCAFVCLGSSSRSSMT